MTFMLSPFPHPQPPTPPKQNDDDHLVEDALKSLDSKFSSPISRPRPEHAPQSLPNPDTPPPSSPLQRSPIKQLEKKTKRLRFCSEARVCGEDDSSGALEPISVSSSAPILSKSLPRSKSILKVSDHNPSSSAPPNFSTGDAPFPPAHTFDSLASMLQTVGLALEGPNLHTRRDAYSALTNCLRTFKDFPDFEALMAKASMLELYIERDFKISDATVKIAEQALQCAFILIGRIPQSMSQSFLAAIIDRSITILEERSVHKEITKHQLNLLTLDELHGKSMTLERVKRLLKGLAEVDSWLHGQSILQLRMMIYRLVATHQPNAFLDDVQNYLPPVFHCLLSSTKELRLRAVETAYRLSIALGTRQRFIQAVEVLLSTQSKDATPYSSRIRNALQGMLQRAFDIDHVPQIWGVVMLLIRGHRALFEKWLMSKEWVMIIQTCFNKSGETKLNQSAWLAWNQTIFAAGGLVTDNDNVRKRLTQPVVGHLQREQKSDVDPTKQAAYSTLYLLWFTAFGQPLGEGKTEACWHRLVHDVSRKVMEKNPQEAENLISIISLLLSGQGLKIWKAERALETRKTPLSRDDIPRMDSLWLRRNCMTVLNTIKLFIETRTSTDGEAQPLRLLWSSLMKSWTQAAEKEIKTSTETKRAIAAMLNMLHGLTFSPPLSQAQKTRFFDHVCVFVRSAIENLGPDTLVENMMTRSEQGYFKVPLSPTKQSRASVGQLESPIVSLFRLLVVHSDKIEADRSTSTNISAVLSPLSDLRGGSWAVIRVLHDCTSHLGTRIGLSPQLRSPIPYMWQATAELASATLEQSNSTARGQVTDSLGQEYHNTMEILILGLSFHDAKSWTVVRSLYQVLSSCVREDTGDGGYILAVATLFTKKCSTQRTILTSSLLRSLTIILDHGITTPDEKSLSHAGKALGGRYSSGVKDASFEWWSSLCRLVAEALSRSYADLQYLDQAALDSFLEPLLTLYKTHTHSEPHLGPMSDTFASEIQVGLLEWINDDAMRIERCSDRGYDLKSMIVQLWTHHLKLVLRRRFSESHPETFAACFIAGIRSPHRPCANATIDIWNTLVVEGRQPRPMSNLCEVLKRLQTITDVQLPDAWEAFVTPALDTTDLPSVDEVLFRWMTIVDSQTSTSAPHKIPHPPPSTFSHSRPLLSASSRSPKTTPKKITLRKSPYARNTRTPPPRLRHDDSQIHFVAVTSSPLQPKEPESQLLTDHQKETRERQKTDAALFSDLRSSSPLRPTAPARQAQKIVQTNRAASLDGAIDVPSSLPEQRDEEATASKGVDTADGPSEEPLDTSKDVDAMEVEHLDQQTEPPPVPALQEEQHDDLEVDDQANDDGHSVTENSNNEPRPNEANHNDGGIEPIPDVFHDAMTDNHAPATEPPEVDPPQTTPRPDREVPSPRDGRSEPALEHEEHTDQQRIEDSFVDTGHYQNSNDTPPEAEVTMTKDDQADMEPQQSSTPDDAIEKESQAPSSQTTLTHNVANTNNQTSTPSEHAIRPADDPSTPTGVPDADSDEDCIQVTQPSKSTPTLYQIMRAQGKIPERQESSATFRQPKRRGRPSPKRSFDAVAQPDSISNSSRRSSPSSERGRPSKRRKSDGTPSRLSQQQSMSDGGDGQDERRTSSRTAKPPVKKTSKQDDKQGPAGEVVSAEIPDVETPNTRRRRRQQVKVVVEKPASQKKGSVATKQDEFVQETEAEEASQPAASLIERMKAMLEEAKSLKLALQDEERASDLAFELQKEISKAARRGRRGS